MLYFCGHSILQSVVLMPACQLAITTMYRLLNFVCCRESEDTLLLILKEIYGYMGISPIKPGQVSHPNPMGQQFASPPPPARPPTMNPSMSPATLYMTPAQGEVGTPVGSYGPPPSVTQPHTPRPLNVGPPPRSGFIKTPNK